jgi:RNA polymerase sigma-70 factor (ECF subfamily)
VKEFDLIYKDLSRDINNYFYYLYGNRDIAAELTQDTFYKVFVSLHTFNEKCSLKTWVFSIAKHTHYQYLTRKGKVCIVEFADNESESFTAQSETKIIVHSALLILKEPYRQVVILHLINDLSFKQIAYLMEKTENWAKVTFHRGKIMLKELIDKEDIE